MTTVDAAVLRGARRVAILVVIAAVAVAAAIGIVAIVFGLGDETTWRVLGTAVIVSVLGTVVLIELALLGAVPRWVSFGVIVLAAVAAVGGIAIAWGLLDALYQAAYREYDTVASGYLVARDAIVRIEASVAIFAAFAVVASLMAPARRSTHPIVRGSLGVTLVLLAVLPTIFTWLIVATPNVGEWFARVIGVLAVLTALGVVATPVLAAVLHRADRSTSAVPPVPNEPGAAGGPARLSAERVERIEKAAAARGVEPDALVDEWLFDRGGLSG